MKLIACPHCGDTYPDFDVAHMCSRGPYAPQLKPRMNERIRQLAEQVYGTQATEQEIKFAELIVKECIWALWTEECRTSDLASEEYTRGSNKIKEHLGVEE
jgi:hypothetical protein